MQTADLENMDAIVLGCGPAGLLAAQAYASLGMEVGIISRKVRSYISGAQFLHEYISDVTPDSPDGIIDVRKEGTREGYAMKVYGDPHAPVSWDNYEGPIPAWSLRKAYDLLWDVWEDRIKDAEVTLDVLEWCGMWDENRVASSIPLPVLAAAWDEVTGELAEVPEPWDFKKQDVWITNRLNMSLARQTIVYNGDPATDWYRASNLWGYAGMEYSYDIGGNPERVKKIQKPLANNVPNGVWDGILRVGRYGAWEKTKLAHHAYTEVLKAVAP